MMIQIDISKKKCFHLSLNWFIIGKNIYSNERTGGMRRKREIMSTYCEASSTDRFEFLYECYCNYRNILNCEKICFIYMVENYMMKEHWTEYCEKYNHKNRKALISRISECMDKGEVIDFILEDENLPEKIIFYYKNYIAMRNDFRIFKNTLESIGGKDEDLLRRYIMQEIDLNDIASERTISYQTAKGKIRDLKKLLKDRTVCYLWEDKAS